MSAEVVATEMLEGKQLTDELLSKFHERLAEQRDANYTAREREPDLATVKRIAKALEPHPTIVLGFGNHPM